MPGEISGHSTVQAGGVSLAPWLMIVILLLHGCALNKLALLERNLQAFGDNGPLSGAGDLAYSPGEAVGMCGGSSPDKVRVNIKHRYVRCNLKLVKRGVIPAAFAATLAQPHAVKHNQVPL